MNSLIRAYVPAADEERVLALWRAALGREWPLSSALFRAITVESPTYHTGDHLVATAGDEITGFAATQVIEGAGEAAALGSPSAAPHPRRRRLSSRSRSASSRAGAGTSRSQ
jgi:hypothetical protein